jgi:uncharacterized protein (TIGR02271 family)
MFTLLCRRGTGRSAGARRGGYRAGHRSTTKEVCIMAEERHDRFTEIEDRYAGYQVYDQDYEKIGKIDDLFVDEYDEPEYIGVKMGLLGTRSTLIPFEIVRINDERELAEVASDKETVKNGPDFDDDQEIYPEFEEQVHRYYGLDISEGRRESLGSGYGAYYSDSRESSNVDTEYGERAGERVETGEYAEQDRYLEDRETTGSASNAGPGMSMGDREGGEFREHPPEEEGVGERESDVDDEDELRVGRSEEELRASKREREVGGVNVRKRVRTDRERMTVPKRREEVKVDRVPVEGEASESEIGEDEVRMPITEEEVEVTKRPVQKEEIRIRKESVEEEEVIEEDVRKEEVEVDDDSERR